MGGGVRGTGCRREGDCKCEEKRSKKFHHHLVLILFRFAVVVFVFLSFFVFVRSPPEASLARKERRIASSIVFGIGSHLAKFDRVTVFIFSRVGIS